MATFLAKLALPEAWPEINDGAVITPQAIEMAMRGLPWKAAWHNSGQLVGRLGWLLATGLGALDHEVVALRSEVRELESRSLQDAKVIVREVISVQAERCRELQDHVERLVARVVNCPERPALPGPP